MIFLPFNSVPPASLPTAYPIYAPVTIVTGHFCHSRSLQIISMCNSVGRGASIVYAYQSSGMGIAPSHAPKTVPIMPP